LNGIRHADVAHGFFDQLGGGGQRGAGLKIKRQRGGGELALMIDRQRRVGWRETGQRRQRHLDCARLFAGRQALGRYADIHLL